MIENVSLGYGIRREPSIPQNSGELSECVNLIPSNGELRNIQPPYSLGIDIKLNDTDDGYTYSGERILAVHNVSGGVKNYVFCAYKSVATYADEETAEPFPMDVYTANGSTLYVSGNLMTTTHSEEDDTISLTATVSASAVSSESDDLEELDVDVKETTSSGVDLNTDSVVSSSQPEKETGWELWYTNGSSETVCIYSAFDTEPTAVEVIGNTLVVFHEGGMYYLLWKDSDGGYKALGSHLPEVGITFGLAGDVRIRRNDNLEESVADSDGATTHTYDNAYSIYGEHREELSNTILGGAATMLNEATEDNEFMQPFLVRYALRLFDGNRTMQSAPVLMIPMSGCNPIFIIKSLAKDQTACVGVQCRLQYMADVDISEWSDIIKGVDVFVSEQFNTYNPSGEIENVYYTNDSSDTDVWELLEQNCGYFKLDKIGGEDHSSDVFAEHYQRWTMRDMLNCAWHYRPDETYSTWSNALAGYGYMPRLTSIEQFNDRIRTCGVFNLFGSIELDDLTTDGMVDVTPKSDSTLTTSDTQTTLTDDYYSHDTLLPTISHVYNKRLNVVGSRELFGGFSPRHLIPYVEECRGWKMRNQGGVWLVTILDDSVVSEDDFCIDSNGNLCFLNDDYSLYKQLIDGGRIYADQYTTRYTLVLDGTDNSPSVMSSPTSLVKIDNYVVEQQAEEDIYYYTEQLAYLFYPNPHATAINVGEYYFKLYEHEALNGACSFKGNYYPLFTHTTDYWAQGDSGHYAVTYTKQTCEHYGLSCTPNGSALTTTVNNIVAESTTLWTSAVGNPYYFPLDGVNEIGSGGSIIGLATATKALSLGQFGKYPLYVFTANGIWAMDVSTTGLYDSITPLSRDICTNVSTIVETDGEVYFASSQGMKMISGSSVGLMSVQMNGKGLNSATFSIPRSLIDDLTYKMLYRAFRPLTRDTSSELFAAYVKDCRAVYDYPNGLIHLYPPTADGSGEHYVYNIEEKEFAAYVGHDLTAFAKDTQASVLQIGTALYTYDKYISDEKRCGFFVTRPLSFGDPYSLKILNDIEVLATREADSSLRYAIFVSNDNIYYEQIYSLRHHAFKYFRLAFFTELYDTDRLSGIGISYDTRRPSKLR